MSRTDLTGYAALFGESLSSKADLLDRLIGDAHYLSLGQYKEDCLRTLSEDSCRELLRLVQDLLCFLMPI